MPRSIAAAFLLSCLVSACSNSVSFNQAIWVDNPSVNDTHNPRAKMVQDLMENQLKPGMSRREVLNLLGTPYRDGIEQRMPRGSSVPDSIAQATSKSTPQNQQKALDRFNSYYKAHSQPDTLMLYPVGWSIIDPNFLAIQFNGKGQVREYWIEEH
jgi:hypothetical protein